MVEWTGRVEPSIPPKKEANEHELLKQKLEIAIKALDEIYDGYLRGEREMEACASVGLMDIKDLDGK